MNSNQEINRILNQIANESKNPVVHDCFQAYQHCHSVGLNLEAAKNTAEKLVETINSSPFEFKTWKQNTLNPKIANDFALNWVFWIDCMNFSFWSDLELNSSIIQSQLKEQKYGVIYDGELYQGYWSLCACYNRAIDSQIPILDPIWILNASESELKQIFYSDYSTVEPYPPLLDDRIRVLKQTAQILTEKFNGNVVELITQSGQSALQLVELVTTHFPSFKDQFRFNNQTVKIHKRAQILVADIWACFEGESYGKFSDINEITMFADYRVPQALLYFQALSYNAATHQKLSQSFETLPSGSDLEIEIRVQSILSVELIRYYLKSMKQNGLIEWNPILIDFYMWGYAKYFKDDLVNYPIHRTRSIFY